MNGMLTHDIDKDAPRVLHLLKWLPRGGIETWLTHVFGNSVGSPVRHEVLLMQEEIGPYEAKVRAAGVRIHTLPVESWSQWFRALFLFLRREGPFDVFHTHVNAIVSGPAAVVAQFAGVPVRLVHNHAARSAGSDYRKLKYRLRDRFGYMLAKWAANRRIAISEVAMEHLAGRNWRASDNCTILLYGFDYGGFHDAEERAAAVRNRLGIAPSVTVLGHVGRFDPVKNHLFLVEAFAHYRERDPSAVLVLVGKGPLQQQCKRRVADLSLQDHVRFAGGTDDVAAFMRMFDVFLLPSFSEGLGIVALEAQAAGTPVLMPENMPREVIVIDEGVTLMPLEKGAQAWAEAVEDILARHVPDRVKWLQRVEASRFGMARCVDDLNAIYVAELAQAG